MNSSDTVQSLQELLNMGFIQQEEFNKRRAALNSSSSIPVQDFKSIKQAASIPSSSSGSTIYFNDPSGPYACFSNHYMTAIYIDGKSWPSTEHYFQAMKFTGPAYQDQIRRAGTTEEAKQLGYAKRPDFRANWDVSIFLDRRTSVTKNFVC
jgi:predicted NAD-dependent protein-ADP-ribosyltransferase YbiA (DUF1768 family)